MWNMMSMRNMMKYKTHAANWATTMNKYDTQWTYIKQCDDNMMKYTKYRKQIHDHVYSWWAKYREIWQMVRTMKSDERSKHVMRNPENDEHSWEVYEKHAHDMLKHMEEVSEIARVMKNAIENSKHVMSNDEIYKNMMMYMKLWQCRQ